MHLNGLTSPDALGMDAGAFHHALRGVAEPNMIGAGMVLNARGNVYGDESTVDPAVVARRRAANKAARRARATHRKAARR